MTISLIFAIIFCSVFYVGIPILLGVFYRQQKINRIFAIILLCLFLIVLSLGVFTNFSVKNNLIYINFDYSKAWASESLTFNSTISLFDFGVNFVMLMPIGVVFTLFSSYKEKFSIFKNLLFSLLLGLGIGFGIELIQFILPIERSIQLTDVLLNAVSCLFGSLYFIIILKVRQKICK